MEAQEQKKILVNPNFIQPRKEQVKPKVHFNPVFLQKCAAAAAATTATATTTTTAQKNNDSSSQSSISTTVQIYDPPRDQVNINQYDLKQLPMSGKVSQTKPVMQTLGQTSLVKHNHSPYKFSTKPLNLKSKPLNDKIQIWQHNIYKKQNIYSHKYSHLTHQPAVVKTTASVVKPPPAYSWTSQGSCFTSSSSVAVNADQKTLSLSKAAIKNHREEFSKSNTLVSHSGNVVPSRISPIESKVLYSHPKSKNAASMQRSKKYFISQMKAPITVMKSDQSIEVSDQSMGKKTAEITSNTIDNKFQNVESSSILVNPKFLHQLSAKGSTSISTNTPSVVTQTEGNSKLKTIHKIKEAIQMPELKEAKNIHKNGLDRCEKVKYTIVSKTKLVRQNSTTNSKSKCLRVIGGIKSQKIQKPVIVYGPSARVSGKRRVSIVSQTKLIRSNSKGNGGTDKMCAKPKFSYKSQTKLVRMHSCQGGLNNSAVRKTIVQKAEPIKYDSERQKKFTVLSKTKLVRRRSNSGSFKTIIGKTPGKIIPVYQNTKAIIKRHKLVRNSNSLSHHHWLKMSQQDARLRTVSMLKATNNNTRISVNQKLAKGIISKYKINRLKCEQSEASITRIHSSFSDSRRKFKVSVVSRERYRSPKKHSDRFINIGGILYKSTKTTLRKQLAKNVTRTSRRPAESCTVILRGERFHLAAGGRTLQRVKGRFESNLTTRPSLPRVHIGGLTYSRTQTGQYKLTSTHYTRAVLSSAKQRSITTLMMQRRKKGSLQKRNQYCVFFNRFGRCTKKERGECPFIHDAKRVAVCTRFLKGRCPIKTCPFSHTVDPSKMPVCSHFLRSVCIRDPCPYRHIKVNPAAPICLDFVRGYCQAGSECKKQHVLICEEYQWKGKCSRGKSCPLAHHKGNNKYTPTITKLMLDEGPEKKPTYALHRRRKKSESDVLGRAKSKRNSEVFLRKSLKVPSQRYFSLLLTDEGKEIDKKIDTCEKFEKKSNCDSSQSSFSELVASTLSSSDQTVDIQSDKKQIVCALTYDNQENSALKNTTSKIELQGTRQRILEKVDKLKKAYTNLASSDLTKHNIKDDVLSCSKNVVHNNDGESSGIENSSKDEQINDISALSNSSLVQRQPLPKRLPSYIPLTMDETTADM